MKNLLEGLDRLKEANKNSTGGNYLRIGDGESATVRFLQELDRSGENYSEDRGVAVGIYQHSNPDDFSQSFLCTKEEEGKCVGCERIPLNKKWRAKGRLLINVFVRGTGGDNSEVKVLATSIGNKGLTPVLIEFAEEYKTLCDRDYKLKRSGEGINTTYTLLPRDASPFKAEEKKAEVIDFREVYNALSYDEQQEMLGETVVKDAKEDW